MDYKAYLRGSVGQLVLAGSPPSPVRTSLRVLDDLGLLNTPMVWEMLSQAKVDPLFLIRTLRDHKAALGFHTEELQVGDTLVMLAGDKTKLGHKVAYHIHVFTNDVTVMVRDGDNYLQHAYVNAEELLGQLHAIAAGDERLQRLLDVVKSQVDAALAYR